MTGGRETATAKVKTVIDESKDMPDKKFTLLELHFDGGFQIGPETVGIGGGDVASEEDESEDDNETDRSSPVLALVGLVAVLAAAAVVRKLVGGDSDDEYEQENLEEFEAA